MSQHEYATIFIEAAEKKSRDEKKAALFTQARGIEVQRRFFILS